MNEQILKQKITDEEKQQILQQELEQAKIRATERENYNNFIACLTRLVEKYGKSVLEESKNE